MATVRPMRTTRIARLAGVVPAMAAASAKSRRYDVHSLLVRQERPLSDLSRRTERQCATASDCAGSGS